MPKTQKISQKKWFKGVNAASTVFAQPQGSFPRGSNTIYTQRGGLITCDGTQLISAFNGFPQPSSTNIGPITEIFLFEPIGSPNAYYGISKDYNTHLAVPMGLAVVDGGTSGMLSAGMYNFVITATDGAGGETTASGVVSITFGAANHKANLSWTAVPEAAGYNVYAQSPLFPAVFMLVNPAPINAITYVDNVPDTALINQNPPSTNTTQVSQFYHFAAPSYSTSDIVLTFPADPIVNIDGTPGGGGGGAGPGNGGGVSTSGNAGPSPQGGTVGAISPIPLIVQFNNLMILLLGNGLVPYSSDGTTAKTIPLINTFVATYPARIASNPQVAGDMITVNVGGTNYLFKATQGGTTAAGGGPTFPSTLNKTVADGSVIWQNISVVATSMPPRGAAHGIVYAGSLWVGNTSPTTTSDNQDGPSCLKMSDLNNPNSWNPLNLAFLDRDDGTQITGLATFTIAEAGIPPTGSLVVFKDFSTFQINGVFGSSSFSIQRAQTDLGCSASRTIQFVPGFGIGRMTHLGIAIFDGVRDRLISEEIRPYIFGGQADISPVDWNFVWFSKGSATADPPMYICAVPIIPRFDGTLPIPQQIINANGISGNLPSNNYAVQAILYKTDGTVWLTNVSPVTGFVTGMNVTFPTVPDGLYWQVFYGIYDPANPAPPQPNQYTYVSYGTASVNIVNPGLPGVITSSNGQLRRLFCYDLVLKAWAIIDLPFPISAMKQFRTIGSIPITVMAGFFDGATRRWQMGDEDWGLWAVVAGQSQIVEASIRTPEVFGREASDRTYFREVAVRGVGDPTSLKCKITTNGLGGQTLPTQNFKLQIFGSGEFVAYLDIGISAVDAYATLSWDGPLEIDSLDWSASPKAVTGRVVAV